MGKLYRAIHINKQVPQVEFEELHYDSALVVPGYEVARYRNSGTFNSLILINLTQKFLEEARRYLQDYNADLIRIMNDHGIRTEAEVSTLE